MAESEGNGTPGIGQAHLLFLAISLGEQVQLELEVKDFWVFFPCCVQLALAEISNASWSYPYHWRQDTVSNHCWLDLAVQLFWFLIK